MKRSPRHDWRESRGARGGSDPQSHVRLEGAPADVRAFGRWFTKNANEDEEAVPLVPLKGKDLERNALASKTRRQPTAPQGVPPGLVSATGTASAALTWANRGQPCPIVRRLQQKILASGTARKLASTLAIHCALYTNVHGHPAFWLETTDECTVALCSASALAL